MIIIEDLLELALDLHTLNSQCADYEITFHKRHLAAILIMMNRVCEGRENVTS